MNIFERSIEFNRKLILLMAVVQEYYLTAVSYQ